MNLEPNPIEIDDDFPDIVVAVANGLPARDVSVGADTTAAESFHLTDLGNAQRFASRNTALARYCRAWRKWLIYDGQRWIKDDTGVVMEYARYTVRAIYAEASEESDHAKRKEIVEHAKRSESQARIEAMLTLAETEEGIRVSPAQFDVDPHKFNVANGTLDLLSRTLLPHDPDNLITKLAPVVFDEEATPGSAAPTFLAFLHRIFDGNENLIRFLQKSIGYSLTGSTREQCLFLFWGTGANGKTTFIETMRALFGDYGMAAAFSTFTQKRGRDGANNDVARLQGARFVSATEGSDGQRLDEQLVKQVTGGDTIAARYLYGEFFEFPPAFKIFLATNHRPAVKGTDHAIWRRMRLLPFNVTIPEEEQDKELADKLKAELAGILTWAVEGYTAWRSEGLGIPDEVKKATNDYREDEDVLAAFLTDRCMVAENREASARALYTEYTRWASDNGERPMTEKALKARLLERGFDQYRDKSGRMWIGLGIVPHDSMSGVG